MSRILLRSSDFSECLESPISLEYMGNDEGVEIDLENKAHPLVHSVVSEMNEASPDHLPAVGHLHDITPLDVRDFEVELWSEFKPRPVMVTVKREVDGWILSVRRLFSPRAEPCPFLEEDHEEWTLLFEELSDLVPPKHPVFRQLRLLRWTGLQAHDTRSSLTESIRFEPPAEERRGHEHLVTPWPEEAWPRIMSFFIRPFETYLVRYPAIQNIMAAEKLDEFF